MINKLKKMQCRKCLYNMGIIKPIVCPCISCKVYGGDTSPLTVKKILRDKPSSNKKNRR